MAKQDKVRAKSFLDDDDIPPLKESQSNIPPPDEDEDEDEDEKVQRGPLPVPPDDLGNVKPSTRRNKYANPNNPQIAVIDTDGQTIRKRRSIELNISERVLPPLTKGRVAVYKWIEKMAIDPLTKEAPDPKDPWIPGSYLFLDKYEYDPLKKQKLMRNLGRPKLTRDKNGNEVVDYDVEPVEFTAGLCRVVPEENYRKYIFMELHPLNKSNPFKRRGEQPPLFERIDLKNNKTDAFQRAFAELAFEAEKAVVDIIDRDTIIGYAVATGDIKTTGITTDRIKTDLRLWARDKPRDFFALHNNVELPVRLNLEDAVALGLIVYEPDKKRFVDPEAGKEIHVHLIGDDPIDSLVKSLIKPDNQHIYKYIVDLLNYWE